MKDILASLALALVLAWAFSVACCGQSPDSVRNDGKSTVVQNRDSATIRLRVRVEDRSGKPLRKAKGILFKMMPPRTQAGRPDSESTITKGGGTAPSGNDGYVETSPLPLKLAYGLEIQADGFAPEVTRWTHPTHSGAIELPPVQLRRLETLAGTVVDRQGHPVSGVTVIQSGDAAKRLEAVSNRDGHFRLNEVPEGRAIVCFEAPGYRFHGDLLLCPSQGNRIELERVGEANPRVLKPAAVSSRHWSPEQRAAVVKKIYEPLIARVLAQPVVAERDRPILFAAARLDPEGVSARLDHLKFARPEIAQGVRFSIANSLLIKGNPDAALEAIDKFKDVQWKLQAYLHWFDTEPFRSKYPDARRRALAKARAMFDKEIKPADYVYQLCQLAAQLSEIGDQAGARKTIQDCQTLLDKMPAESDGREALAIQLAIAVSRDDVERAKKLAADAEPDQVIRLAAAIARHHPKNVETFLADEAGDLSLMQLRGVANDLPNLCLRVARQDPAAAERLLLKYARLPQPKTDAEKLFGLGGSFGLNLSQEFLEFQIVKLKAVCYGLIAEGAVANDPAAARHALSQSVDLVKPLRAGFVYPMTEFYHSPAVLMALLVPTAERIDPALAREVFWRALSLRTAMSGESHEREMLDIDTCLLANLVRFYDQPLAAFLLDPVFSRIRLRTFSGMASSYWVIHSVTLDSPERALAWADSLGGELRYWDGSLVRDSVSNVIASALWVDAYWDADRGQRLHNELSQVQSIYGVYLNRD
jgi:hypothetical protein